MTTASLLLVGTTWGVSSEKCEKEDRRGNPAAAGSVCVGTVARSELRETPTAREQALRSMRDWLDKNCDVKNVRQDESFLLRFLRHKKFSVPMAQQTLLKYLNLRKYYPEIFVNLDCEDPKIEEILSNGYIMVSPVRDAHGRRVVVYNMGKFNTSKFNCWDMCRAHCVIYESLLEEAATQVCGFTHVGDGSGATGAHVTTWNPTDFARLMKWGEQSLPMRHKEFHLVNVPSVFKYIIDFAVSKASPKMADRVQTYTNVKQLSRTMNTSCLPVSHGGPILDQDMILYTQELLRDQRKKLLGLDEMEILSTRGIISSRHGTNQKADTTSIEGSFRKLEID